MLLRNNSIEHGFDLERLFARAGALLNLNRGCRYVEPFNIELLSDRDRFGGPCPITFSDTRYAVHINAIVYAGFGRASAGSRHHAVGSGCASAAGGLQSGGDYSAPVLHPHGRDL